MRDSLKCARSCGHHSYKVFDSKLSSSTVLLFTRHSRRAIVLLLNLTSSLYCWELLTLPSQWLDNQTRAAVHGKLEQQSERLESASASLRKHNKAQQSPPSTLQISDTILHSFLLSLEKPKTEEQILSSSKKEPNILAAHFYPH